MNDRIDTLLRERFAAQHDPLPALDFADVRTRLTRQSPRTDRGRRSLRRRAVIAAAVLGAALACAAAYAVVQLVIVGAPAPPAVRASAQTLQEVRSAMTALNPGGQSIEIAKTKAAAVLETSDGPVYLWVAPTTNGHRCMYLQITGLDVRFADGGPFLMAAGCVPPDQQQALLVRVNAGVNGHTLPLVAGYIPDQAKALQLHFGDGTDSERYTATDGFVIALGSRTDPAPTAILQDRSGQTIIPNPAPYIRQLFVSASPIGVTEFTITTPLLDNQGTLRLRVWPAAKGGSCRSLQLPWGTATACGPNHTTADSINVGRGFLRSPRKPEEQFRWLEGQVGTNIATLELRYEDGSHEKIPIRHHWILFQVRPKNFAAGHRPVKLVGRNAAGQILATHGATFNFCVNLGCRKNVKVVKSHGHRP